MRLVVQFSLLPGMPSFNMSNLQYAVGPILNLNVEILNYSIPKHDSLLQIPGS